MMRNRATAFRGFLLVDAVFGLAIVSVLTVTLAIAVSRSAESVRRVRLDAEANAIAERLLNEMHMGRRPPESPDGYTYEIESVSGGDREVGGGKWVRVTVRLDGRAAELLGVIPGHMQGVLE